jgi:hypothetical protein
MTDDLYAVDARERLRASREFAAAKSSSVPPRVEELPPGLQAAGRRVEALGDVMSPINAWLLFVGPSYGRAPDDLESHYLKAGPQAPTLGRRHPNSESQGTFFAELVRWGTAAFTGSGVFQQPDDAWAMAGLMNLVAGWSGDASKLTAEELLGGAPRFWEAVEIIRPRLVVSLTSSVYTTVQKTASSFGAQTEEEIRDVVPGGGQTYKPRSRWTRTTSGWTFLLAAAPNHPSRMSLQVPDETYGYLARQVERAQRRDDC